MLKGSTREVYKLSREVVKEVTSIYIGPIGYSIIEYCVETGVYTFTPAHIVEYLIAKGYARREDKEKLHKRVHDAIKRLMSRGLVARISYGWYKLLLDPGRVNLRVALLPSLARVRDAVKEAHGTREPHGRGVGGVFLDNVRGWRGGVFVGGDRGRVLGFGDLVFFNRVSYSEFAVATGTDLLEGLGLIAIYYACKSGPGGRVVCSDWVEWRPPRGFVKRFGVFNVWRFFVNVILPRVFGLISRACVIAGVPFKYARRFIWRYARGLYGLLTSSPPWKERGFPLF